MKQFFKGSVYKKYNDEIWGKVICSRTKSQIKKNILLSYKEYVTTFSGKLKMKFMYKRSSFLKNALPFKLKYRKFRSAYYTKQFNTRALSRLENRTLPQFSLITTVRQRKFGRLHRRIAIQRNFYLRLLKRTQPLLSKRYMNNLIKTFFLTRLGIKNTKSIKRWSTKMWFLKRHRKRNGAFIKIKKFDKRIKSTKSERKASTKVWLRRNRSFGIKSKLKSILGSSIKNVLMALPLIKFPKKISSINTKRPSFYSNIPQLIAKREFLASNALQFHMRKIFRVKRRRVFFYAVHIVAPRKKLEVHSLFAQRAAYYRKISLFYGFENPAKFKSLAFKSGSMSKFGSYSYLLFLEARLETILLRCNFLPSIYFIKKFIKGGKVFINNKTIRSPIHVVRLSEIVSIDRSYHNYIYNYLLNSLTKGYVLLNTPSFIEIDYHMLVIMLIRNPTYRTLTAPASFKLYTTSPAIHR